MTWRLFLSSWIPHPHPYKQFHTATQYLLLSGAGHWPRASCMLSYLVTTYDFLNLMSHMGKHLRESTTCYQNLHQEPLGLVLKFWFPPLFPLNTPSSSLSLFSPPLLSLLSVPLPLFLNYLMELQWASTWVLWTEPRFSAKAGSVPNHWAFSPVPKLQSLKSNTYKCSYHFPRNAGPSGASTHSQLIFIS